MKTIEDLAKKHNLNPKYVQVVLDMLEEGNTLQFIARYRKEQTGAMDEEQIKLIKDEFDYLVNLNARKEAIIRLIDEKGLLHNELKEEILACEKLSALEDIYRPYKEKKKTKATVAIALGLEPLAKLIYENNDIDLEFEASKYLTPEVTSTSQAIELAKDIIAEIISDNAKYRKFIKAFIEKEGILHTKLNKKNEALDERKVYQNYYDTNIELSKLTSHRILAINRGEKEKILTVKIGIEQDKIVDFIKKDVLKRQSNCSNIIVDAIIDSLKRLIMPSVEREIRSEMKSLSDDKSIEVFTKNLENLLLTPPIKNKTFLGVDPAFRTGCKLAVVDQNARLQEIAVIYQNQKFKDENVPVSRIKDAKETVLNLVKKYNCEVIAIGNGTASRETEEFISEVISEYNLDVDYIIVSEAGASVYSASKEAIKEFPDLDLEKRSAISIARRVIDPLAELVKIDPKSIGVGQYQHDVDQNKLKDSLDFTVSKVVNQVGVNINTSSVELLSYVSGVNSKIAENITEYIKENGRFKSRAEIKKVKGLGPKSYVQAIGFLRVFDSENSLDQTDIHPESYAVTESILKELGFTKSNLGTKELNDKLNSVNLNDLFAKVDTDRYTFDDIIESLKQPLRDLRDKFDTPILKKGVISIDSVAPGDTFQGTVRNITDFGAFVDLGLKIDGLVHLSKITKRYIKHPSEVLEVGQIVDVTVLEVDKERHRMSLTMIK